MNASTARVRDLFPGGNTAQGFYSFFDQITGPAIRRIFVIKGGPGVGKSTLMRRVAEAALARGHAVELHHCSSDNDSLDGVVIPDLGTALIDGTAPHVVDPRHPGGIDTIVHLGDFWDEAAMRREREAIVDATREVGRLFRRAYAFLAAAKLFRDQKVAACVDSGAVDFAALNRTAEAVAADLFRGRPSLARLGRERHLFASAITPDGLRHHFDSLFGPVKRRVILKGPAGTGKSTFVRRLAELAVFRGYDVEVFHDGLGPARVEHVLIPALDAALITGAEPHAYPAGPGDHLIDTEEFLARPRLAPFASELQQAEALYAEAFTAAVGFLHRAKEVHDELEQHYVPHMDFAALGRRTDELLDEIFSAAPAEQPN